MIICSVCKSNIPHSNILVIWLCDSSLFGNQHKAAHINGTDVSPGNLDMILLDEFEHFECHIAYYYGD